MVELKVPVPDDASVLAAAIRESVDDLRPWMEWARVDYGIEEAHSWIERCAAEREQGTAYEFFFTDGEGKFLGACGLNRISTVNRLANLGYWIRSSAAGHGLTANAVRQLAAWAFSSTELHRLEIVVGLENRRSQRVAEKVGAQREAILRSRLWLYEVPHDAVLYGIVRPFAPSAEPGVSADPGRATVRLPATAQPGTAERQGR